MPTQIHQPQNAAMTRSQVMQEVKQIVAGFASMPADQIQETHDLEKDLGCDSLDLAEITMEVEEHFDISVPDDKALDLRTVGNVTDGVLQLLNTHRGD
jgi:acyl carrier protein